MPNFQSQASLLFFDGTVLTGKFCVGVPLTSDLSIKVKHYMKITRIFCVIFGNYILKFLNFIHNRNAITKMHINIFFINSSRVFVKECLYPVNHLWIEYNIQVASRTCIEHLCFQ